MKKRKARQKRWYKARIKAQRKAQFIEAFRRHFVNKGILKED